MKNRYFLIFASDLITDVKDSDGYDTKAAACRAYMRTAEELDRYGQQIEASLHIAPSVADIVEYPHFVLSLGPRGGLVCERCY